MPQDAPQLDPQYDWAKLPNGEYAKFKKGTSKVEIQGRLTAAGLLPKPKPTATPESVGGMSPYKTEAMRKRAETTSKIGIGEVAPGAHTPMFGGHMPWYGFTPGNIADNMALGIKGIATSTKDIGKDLLSNPNWFKTMPEGSRPSTMQKFVTEPAMRESAVAKESFAKGRTSEGVGHFLASGIPLIGPMLANMGEQAGRSDVGGAVGQAVGMYAGGKVMAKGTEMIVDKATGMISPESLRRRAADLNTKVLRTATPNARDFGMSTGLQVAKERIISNLKELPSKIEAKRAAKNVQVQSIAQALDTKGTTIDISKEIQPIVDDVQAVANQRALLTPQLRTQIKGLLNRVTTSVDPATGRSMPRNLSTMKVSEALALQKGLEDLSAFGKQAPEAINNLARRLRGVLGEKLDAASPEMQRLRGEESKLIKARDAAKDAYAKALNDNRTLAKGFVYSTAGAAAGYVALKMTGIGFGPAIAGILVLRTLAESTPSRTARAAFYARAADAIDAALGRTGGPQGPKAAPMGGTPQTGGSPPQAVANAQLAAAIGTPEAVAVAVRPQLPAAPSTVSPTGQPVSPDVLAVQSQPGARGVAPDIGKWEPPPELGAFSAKDVGKEVRAKNPEPTRAETRSAERRKTDRTNQQLEDKLFAQARKELGEDATSEQVGARVDELKRARGNVAGGNTKTVAPSPETSARNKAMLDRLDALYERQTNPKSGADRNAIEREISEIKRVLSGDIAGDPSKVVGGKTRSAEGVVKRKISQRETLAAKRAEAKSATPGTSTGSQGSTVDPATRPEASPENRAILLDMGYKKLASYDGGPEMAKALKKMAEDVRKIDPSYDEVTALAEALKALKEVSGQ
jgi:hypothetical protein